MELTLEMALRELGRIAVAAQTKKTLDELRAAIFASRHCRKEANDNSGSGNFSADRLERK
jgi:hypothetical protein